MFFVQRANDSSGLEGLSVAAGQIAVEATRRGDFPCPLLLGMHMSNDATRQLWLWVLTLTAAALVVTGSARAGTYTVVSCNSAQAFGFNASAWERYSNTGSAYETCPTGG